MVKIGVINNGILNCFVVINFLLFVVFLCVCGGFYFGMFERKGRVFRDCVKVLYLFFGLSIVCGDIVLYVKFGIFVFNENFVFCCLGCVCD